MKKNLLKTTFMVLCFAVFAACGGNSDKTEAKSSGTVNEKDQSAITILTYAAQEANKQLQGQQLDEVTTFVSCGFENNCFTYRYMIDENLVSIEDLRAAKDEIKKVTYETLQNESDFVTGIQPHLQQLHSKLMYVYTGSQSEESMTIEYQY